MKPFDPQASSSNLVSMQLIARRTAPLVDQQGQRVSCLEGIIWITQHRDERDIVLKAGQSFVLDRPGLAIVFALQDALITLGPAQPDAMAA